MTFKTYEDAVDSLPDWTKLSSTFGYPGEGGYNEIWRNPDGRRWNISNGSWDAFKPFLWTVEPID